MRLTTITMGMALTVGLGLTVQLGAQAPARAGRGRGAQAAGGAAAAPARPQRRGNYEQNMRQLAPPEVLAQGKTLYEANCSSCHGVDLRGGKNGGNLLISQIVLNDRTGEMIEPVVAGSQAELGMPAMSLSKGDVDTIAAYIHSIAAEVGSQGRPPGAQTTPGLKVLVGDAVAGKADFDKTCGSCHSVTPGGQRSVAGIGAKYADDARALQNAWLSGRASTGFSFSRGGGGGASGNPVTVTLANGQSYTGKLIEENEFVVAMTTPDGQRHSFERTPNVTVKVTDPEADHKQLMLTLGLAPNGDTVMHNITAYLATLK